MNDCPAVALGFTTLDCEVAQVPLPVSGHLPDWLTGSLLRTGPARFEIGRQRYRHWFDGLAMLHAFNFDCGSVRYSNRFLHSGSWRDAERNGRIARGEFMTDPCATLFGRVRARFRPTDNGNVSIAAMGERLVALTETPMPVRFDPHTLETLDDPRCDSDIKGHITTAHPHSDGFCSYSYMIEMGHRSLYRVFAEERGRSRVLTELSAERPSYMHSFGMSDRYLVLTEFPLRVNPLRLVFSVKPFICNYRWEPWRDTIFTVVDKQTGCIAARARAPACFGFHHVNAFEQDRLVHVDILVYPDASIIDRLQLDGLRRGEHTGAAATLTRFSIPVDPRCDAPVAIEGHSLCDTSFELPRFDYHRRAGRAYSRIWGVGQSHPDAFLDTVIKVELDCRPARVRRWHRTGCYAGEPVFVARPNSGQEEDGVLLSVVLDTNARTSFLLVLDAATLEERARASVPHHIPFGFHGDHFPDLDRVGTLKGRPGA